MLIQEHLHESPSRQSDSRPAKHSAEMKPFNCTWAVLFPTRCALYGKHLLLGSVRRPVWRVDGPSTAWRPCKFERHSQSTHKNTTTVAMNMCRTHDPQPARANVQVGSNTWKAARCEGTRNKARRPRSRAHERSARYRGRVRQGR